MKSSSTVKLWGFWKVTAVQQREGKIWEIQSPFQNKALKIPFTFDLSSHGAWKLLTSADLQIRFKCSMWTNLCLLSLCTTLNWIYHLLFSLFPHFCLTFTQHPHLLFNYFDTCFALLSSSLSLICFSSPLLSICKSPSSSSHLDFSVFIYLLCSSLTFTLCLSPHVLLLHASPYFTPGCPCS